MEQAFFEFMQAIDLQQFNDMHKSDWGATITYVDIHYLFIINHRKSTTVSELADIMNVSRPAVTQKINELHALNLVEKIQSKEDKRYVSITLSDKVRKSSESSKSHTVLDVVKKNYSKQEQEIFTSILKTMADYIKGGQ